MSDENKVPDYSIEVLHEDKDVIVINKPAGIAMHKINDTEETLTVRDIFANKLANNDDLRGGIVHRLDKDTSGVVIMAKNDQALNFLQGQFADRTVDKTYLALVWGKLKHEKARIELPLSRSSKSPVAIVVSPAGKISISEYRLLKEIPPYSYLEVSLHTGRTHQIRVQFAHMGHPVVGDKMYGNKSMPAGLGRQFLHASELSLVLPGQKQKTTFKAPLASDLRAFLEYIGG